MRKQEVDRKLFHRAHYNILAKQIREKLTPAKEAVLNFQDENDLAGMQKAAIQVATLIDLAVALTNRLALDSADFKPEMFLDACSPDPEVYPLSELWEGVDDSEVES